MLYKWCLCVFSEVLLFLSSSSAANLEACIPEKVLPEKRVSFVPEVSSEQNIDKDVTEESTNEYPLESEDSTPVRAVFELPHLSIKLCGELNKTEHEFVDIVLYDFSLSYEHTKPTVTLFDVSLGGLLVKDLLQDPESPYRYLISSSSPRQHRSLERSLSAYPSRLSSSCPVVSDAGLNQRFSSSLPHVLSLSPRQNAYRSLAPLRPLLKSDKFPSLPSVITARESDAPLDDSTSASVNENKDSNLVHVKVLLIDKKDDEFTTKYTSVRHGSYNLNMSLNFSSCLGKSMNFVNSFKSSLFLN